MPVYAKSWINERRKRSFPSSSSSSFYTRWYAHANKTEGDKKKGRIEIKPGRNRGDCHKRRETTGENVLHFAPEIQAERVSYSPEKSPKIDPRVGWKENDLAIISVNTSCYSSSLAYQLVTEQLSHGRRKKENVCSAFSPPSSSLYSLAVFPPV